MDDKTNLITVPILTVSAYMFPFYSHYAIVMYLLLDCKRSYVSKRDYQILLHHMATLCLIIRYHFLHKYQEIFHIFGILESSSYLIILGRYTKNSIIKKISKIYWVFVRLIFANVYQYVKWNDGLDTCVMSGFIKWLGYMWTLEIFGIHLTVNQLSLIASHENILLLSIFKKDVLMISNIVVLLTIGTIHHSNTYHSNKIIHKMDNCVCCLTILHSLIRFSHNSEYMYYFTMVCLFYIIVKQLNVQDRSWRNFKSLTAHIAMHISSGSGLLAVYK